MSWIVTEGSVTDPRTGLPIPDGNILTTESGILLVTTPVGEAPGGINTTPGIVSAALTWTNPGWLQPAPGTPYGISAPVYIGPLLPL